MDLTPEQLRHLRDERGLSREQLAAELGDCTASTINKWERGINPIPAWVGEKMFAKMDVSFSMEELSEMFELCRELQLTISELFQQSVRQLILSRRKQQEDKIPKRRNVTYQSPRGGSRLAAEDESRYLDKTGTED